MIREGLLREELPKMWGWLKEFREQMVDDNSPQTYQELLERYDHDTEHGAKMYVLMQGEPKGCVWAERHNDEQFIGHLVFDRDLLPSDKLAFAKESVMRMFDSGVKQVLWFAFKDNRPFRIFLKRLGAKLHPVELPSTTRDGKEVPIEMWVSEGACEQ